MGRLFSPGKYQSKALLMLGFVPGTSLLVRVWEVQSVLCFIGKGVYSVFNPPSPRLIYSSCKITFVNKVMRSGRWCHVSSAVYKVPDVLACRVPLRKQLVIIVCKVRAISLHVTPTTFRVGWTGKNIGVKMLAKSGQYQLQIPCSSPVVHLLNG